MSAQIVHFHPAMSRDIIRRRLEIQLIARGMHVSAPTLREAVQIGMYRAQYEPRRAAISDAMGWLCGHEGVPTGAA